MRPVPEADYRRLLARMATMYIYSRVDYEDIFHPKQERHSEISAKAEFNGEFVVPGLTVSN